MARNDDANLEGRLHGDQPEDARAGLAMRLVHLLLISVMLSLAGTLLTALTVIQFIVMALSKGEPNRRLADFGTDLGIWMAKAARYQAAASEVKPWPWTDLD